MILSRFFTLLVVCGIQFASDGRSVANSRGWPERPGVVMNNRNLHLSAAYLSLLVFAGQSVGRKPCTVL